MSAIGATAASASEPNCKPQAGGKYDFLCIKSGSERSQQWGTASEARSENFRTHLVSGTHVALEWKLGGEVITLSCETMAGSGTLTSGDEVFVSFSRTVKLEGCKDTAKTPRCSVGLFEMSPTEKTGGRFREAQFFSETQLATNSGTLVLSSLTGKKCALPGTFHVYGGSSTVECKMPEVEAEKVSHTQVCSGELGIQSGGVPPIRISYEDAIELSGTNLGKTFSIFLGT